jgi:hypothetical protein|nr:MAG TPA: hypothetical protein [Caudoviricetes sp.]
MSDEQLSAPAESSATEAVEANPAPEVTLNEHGYPANTPVAEMSAEHQAAYYKHHSRLWESRAKENRNTAERLRQEQANAPVKDQTDEVNSLRQQIESLRAQQDDERFSMAFSSAVKQANAPHLETLKSTLNRDMFRDDDGRIDTAKVAEYVSSLAPTNAVPQQPAAAPGLPVGFSQKTTPEKGSAAAGHELYANYKKNNPVNF